VRGRRRVRLTTAVSNQNVTSRIAKRLWDKRHPEWADGHAERLDPQLHLTAGRLPRYAFDRLVIRAREKLRGREPWITHRALQLLDEMLEPTHRGLEYGAGGTTAWFAQRVAFLDSVEAFSQWYGPLRDDLDRQGITNVDLHLVPAEDLGYETDAHREAYVCVHPELLPGSLDFVLVDGEYRDHCARRGMELLRSGGVLVLDNADLYVPTDSRSPFRLSEPSTPVWAELLEELAGWRRISTTNGVWDTDLWIKP
jgi:hypothetical protein